MMTAIIDLLVCLFMVFNASFINMHNGGQFFWWRNPEFPEKTTDLSQVIDKLTDLQWVPNINKIKMCPQFQSNIKLKAKHLAADNSFKCSKEVPDRTGKP